jgi:hypothetical protein
MLGSFINHDMKVHNIVNTWQQTQHKQHIQQHTEDTQQNVSYFYLNIVVLFGNRW